MMGDVLFRYKEPQRAGVVGQGVAYMMAMRTGIDFILYPWKSHLTDAAEGAKQMLTLFGEWTYTESVAEAFGLCFFFVNACAL